MDVIPTDVFDEDIDVELLPFPNNFNPPFVLLVSRLMLIIGGDFLADIAEATRSFLLFDSSISTATDRAVSAAERIVK